VSINIRLRASGSPAATHRSQNSDTMTVSGVPARPASVNHADNSVKNFSFMTTRQTYMRSSNFAPFLGADVADWHVADVIKCLGNSKRPEKRTEKSIRRVSRRSLRELRSFCLKRTSGVRTGVRPANQASERQLTGDCRACSFEDEGQNVGLFQACRPPQIRMHRRSRSLKQKDGLLSQPLRFSAQDPLPLMR
jgi:hypothetical protein